MNFIPVYLNNLLQIQSEVSNLIKVPTYSNSKLFYPDNHVNLFLSVRPLRNDLDKLNLLDDVDSIAVIVVDPGKRIPIHTDTGKHKYSLNIPISGYNQTFLNFYKTKNISDSSVLIKSNQLYGNHSYERFNLEDCELLTTHESKEPYIMNTKVPHDVINNSNTLRVFLLVRLQETANDKILSLVN